VILNYPFTDEDLVHLMGRDDDAFNRWEAGQRLAASIILARKGAPPRHSSTQAGAFFRTATRVRRRSAHAAAGGVLAEQMQVVDPDLLHSARMHCALPSRKH